MQHLSPSGRGYLGDYHIVGGVMLWCELGVKIVGAVSVVVGGAKALIAGVSVMKSHGVVHSGRS